MAVGAPPIAHGRDTDGWAHQGRRAKLGAAAPPLPAVPTPTPPQARSNTKKGLLLLPLPVRPEQFHKERHAVARSPFGGGGTVHVEPAPPTLDPARRQVGANEGARAAHLQSPTQEAHT